MNSPIYYCKLFGLKIDLSELLEVGNAFCDDSGIRSPHVGFQYRYRQGETIVWSRKVKEDEERLFNIRWRNSIRKNEGEEPLEAYPSDAELIALGFEKHTAYDPDTGARLGTVIFKNAEGTPLCVVNLQKDIDELVDAWIKWKAIEPEIYAVIRKHLS